MSFLPAHPVLIPLLKDVQPKALEGQQLVAKRKDKQWYFYFKDKLVGEGTKNIQNLLKAHNNRVTGTVVKTLDNAVRVRFQQDETVMPTLLQVRVTAAYAVAKNEKVIIAFDPDNKVWAVYSDTCRFGEVNSLTNNIDLSIALVGRITRTNPPYNKAYVEVEITGKAELLSCTKCNEHKSIEQFSFDHKGILHSLCTACQHPQTFYCGCGHQGPIADFGINLKGQPKTKCKACQKGVKPLRELTPLETVVEPISQPTPQPKISTPRDSAILWLCEQVEQARRSQRETANEIEKAYTLVDQLKSEIKEKSDKIEQLQFMLKEVRDEKEYLELELQESRPATYSPEEERALVSLGYPGGKAA